MARWGERGWKNREGWQERVHNREEWKKLLRTAGNHCILHMPMEWMNEWMNTELYMNKIYGLVGAGNTLWFVTVGLIFWTDTSVHDLKQLKNRLLEVFPSVKNSPWKWLWIAETHRRLYCWKTIYYYVHMCHKLVINIICFLKLCQTEHNLTYTDIHKWIIKKTNKHLTNSIEQSPSWEANLFSASHEVPNIYGTWRYITAFTRACHMPLFWARSIQSMPTHPTFWISNLILGMPGFPSCLFPSCACTPSVPHLCYMPCPSFFSRFYHLNNNGWGMQIIKLLIMCASLPHYLVPPRTKYLPQHFILKQPQPTFLPQCQHTSFTSIQNERQNYISIYLYLYIFE